MSPGWPWCGIIPAPQRGTHPISGTACVVAWERERTDPAPGRRETAAVLVAKQGPPVGPCHERRRFGRAPGLSRCPVCTPNWMCAPHTVRGKGRGPRATERERATRVVCCSSQWSEWQNVHMLEPTANERGTRKVASKTQSGEEPRCNTHTSVPEKPGSIVIPVIEACVLSGAITCHTRREGQEGGLNPESEHLSTHLWQERRAPDARKGQPTAWQRPLCSNPGRDTEPFLRPLEPCTARQEEVGGRPKGSSLSCGERESKSQSLSRERFDTPLVDPATQAKLATLVPSGHRKGPGEERRAPACPASSLWQTPTLQGPPTGSWGGGRERVPRGCHNPESEERERERIWLILPAVICFVQGLSHACLSAHGQNSWSVNGSLHQ